MPSVRDRNIGWLRKEVYYPVQGAEAYTVQSTSQLTTQESSTSVLNVMTGTKFTALSIASTASGVDWFEKIPFDLDTKFPVGITPIWTKDNGGSTHTTSVTWTVKYSQFGAKSAFVAGTSSVIATAATTLTTAIGADTQASSETALTLYRGPRGELVGNTFIAQSLFWAWQILLTAFTAGGGDKVWLIGIVVDYMPHLTGGSGNIRNKVLRSSSTPLAESN